MLSFVESSLLGFKEALDLAFSIWYMFSDPFFFSPPAHISPDVNYEELARCTDDFNGAQCKAVCVEAVSIPLQQIGGKCES